MRKHLPSLDGLRFFAAFFVLVAHYSKLLVIDRHSASALATTLSHFATIGMPLFFVLSGFVIHYNYSDVRRNIKGFLLARFARLYPLYIAVLSLEFLYVLAARRGSCSSAGDRLGDFIALPFHLTLTQDWLYGAIGNNNLINQYPAAVTWSISAEFVFYICYVALVPWLLGLKGVGRHVLFGLLSYLGLVVYFLAVAYYSEAIEEIAGNWFGAVATERHGYDDSLLRWLYYFNPLVNFVAFFMGTLIANLYLQGHRPSGRDGGLLSAASILLIFAGHFWCYGHGESTLRISSGLLTPFIALVIYCLVNFQDSAVSRVIGGDGFVKLGEASYSLYLLQPLFVWLPMHFCPPSWNPWGVFAASIIGLTVLSRASYLYFERPCTRWIRGRDSALAVSGIKRHD